ncbi:transporter substrate-binding domain-containing protein [Microbacterium atlanticum]|uniref:transporter substrate-binding domain-containing protein n=1 Tax=Microbacterium atlanticum TaxID=2782168 RepID=UPI001888FE2D|nr:transporter substrate-binding domain-containing protein [Microbacterium atlanticum]
MSITQNRSARRRSAGALTVVGVAILALAGCASASADADTAAESVVPESDRGILVDSVPEEFADGITVATQADIAPLTYTTDDGEVVGFDQDLLAALSDVVGVEFTVEPVTFENLILGLESGTYDFVADTTIKNERLAKYDMLSYMTSSYSAAGLADADKLDDDVTGLCGHSMGVVSGEVIIDFVKTQIDPECSAAGLDAVSLTEYKDFASTVLAVRSENVEGMIVDTMTFGYFQSGEAGADFAYNGPTRLNPSNSGYSFLKGQNQELAVVIQEALNTLVDDGVYAELLEKYGLTESGVEGGPVLNPEASI